MGLTTDINKRERTRKSPSGNNYTPLSTGSPTYWPTDLNKIPDLLDFLSLQEFPPSYTDIQPSCDLPSDNTPIIVTFSTSIATRIPTTSLHTSHTDWKLYKTAISEKLTTMQKLKTREDIEVATTKLIDTLQQPAISATPIKNSPRHVNNLPTHIKQLIAQKSQG